MQPQANRERIIIRTSLGPTLPPVTADARSVRQILLNLLSNSIKFTGAGGQVIVSTALGDDGDVVLRVRDTGVGMSEQDIGDRARAVPAARDLGALRLGRHRPRPAADQGAGRGQPRELQDQERASTPAPWSRWRSRAPGWRRNKPVRCDFARLSPLSAQTRPGMARPHPAMMRRSAAARARRLRPEPRGDAMPVAKVRGVNIFYQVIGDRARGWR